MSNTTTLLPRPIHPNILSNPIIKMSYIELYNSVVAIFEGKGLVYEEETIIDVIEWVDVHKDHMINNGRINYDLALIVEDYILKFYNRNYLIDLNKHEYQLTDSELIDIATSYLDMLINQ